jgi:hypothetical protein
MHEYTIRTLVYAGIFVLSVVLAGYAILTGAPQQPPSPVITR